MKIIYDWLQVYYLKWCFIIICFIINFCCSEIQLSNIFRFSFSADSKFNENTCTPFIVFGWKRVPQEIKMCCSAKVALKRFACYIYRYIYVFSYKVTWMNSYFTIKIYFKLIATKSIYTDVLLNMLSLTCILDYSLSWYSELKVQDPVQYNTLTDVYISDDKVICSCYF